MRSAHAPKACIIDEVCITHAVCITFRKERISLKKALALQVLFSWCGRRELNPYDSHHTPLKRARLPVPPLPHDSIIIAHFLDLSRGFLNFVRKVFEIKKF